MITLQMKTDGELNESLQLI